MRFVALLILLGAPAWANPAAPPSQPPPPLAQRDGDLDGDGKNEHVTLGRDGVIEVLGADGASRGKLTLAGNPRELASAVIDFPAVEGHPLLHVRARQRSGRTVEAVAQLDGAPTKVGGAEGPVSGQLTPIVNERTGLIGDGDRGVQLRLDEHGLVRYQTSPTVERCDGDDVLFPERWDFQAHRFRAGEDPPPEGAPVTATTKPPEGLSARPVGVFHFSGASTDQAAAADRRADLLAAPRELEDGRPDTAWIAGPPGGGRGAWVTARAQESAHQVIAIRVEPSGATPRALTVLFGARPEQRLTVKPPASGAFFIVPPKPPMTGCVSLVIAEPPQGAQRDTALGEVSIFTDADRAGGLERLAADVAQGKNPDAAAHVLSGEGKASTKAIAAQLVSATGTGRRRLLEVLAGSHDPEAAPALARALESASGAERKIIVEGLAQLGEAGEKAAARLYTDEAQAPEARADAAIALGAIAQKPGPGAREAIEALVAGAGSRETPLRLATVKALGAGGANPEVASALEAALEKEEASPERAERVGDLARALGSAAKASDGEHAARLLATVYGRAPAEAFERKLLILRALGELQQPASAEVLAQAAQDPDEVLRWSAVEAAGRLPSGAGRSVLERGLDDRDPRVRRAAIAGLEKQLGAATPRVITALEKDAWPMVRKQAAEALGSACGTSGVTAVLAHAVAGDGADARGADATEEVRRAALVALGHCAPRDPAIARVLATARQPVAVRELAAVLLAKSGDPKAAQTLADTLDAVLGDPNADEKLQGLAVACVRALARTKDTSRPILESLGGAANEPISAAVRAAAMETIGTLCPEGSGEALHKGEKDPDPTVRRAAGEALRKCSR